MKTDDIWQVINSDVMGKLGYMYENLPFLVTFMVNKNKHQTAGP